MWLLLQGWLLRHVLTLLGWLTAAGGVAAVLFGARKAGRNAERVELSRSNLTSSRLRGRLQEPPRYESELGGIIAAI
jgi:hypothetical protein